MCGIFALINPPGKKVDAGACREATNVLSHRGPDSSGELLCADGEVFLGHRRLSIIDPSPLGAQPMVGDQGQVLIYNGEIYNFISIKGELSGLGLHFKSTCDTEVLLKAMEQWGPACLSKLEGMFAFVLWDPDKEEALAVRDFFGIKPLYYWSSPEGGIAFSSEIKSFYKLPSFAPELNSEGLPEYLQFRGFCGNETLLRGVRQVAPGELIKVSRRGASVEKRVYWDPAKELPSRNLSMDVEEFLDIFRGTVRRHLIADVPVGTQFSGGIDSSLISAIAVKDLGAPLTAFHCRVPDAAYDETPWAIEAAAFLGMPLRERVLPSELFFSDLLEKLTWHHDEPLMHPNSMGIYLVSEIAKDEVKVLLSGEAADELFCGYSRYPLTLILNALGKNPYCFGLGSVLFRSLGLRDRIFPSLGHGAGQLPEVDEFIVGGTGFLRSEDLTDLLGDPEAYRKSLMSRRAVLESIRHQDPTVRCQLYDVKTYLPPLFMRQDKMSMAASIEKPSPVRHAGNLQDGPDSPPERSLELSHEEKTP